MGRLEGISPADLAGQGIIASRQALAGTLRDWAGDALDRMDVVATFNLPLNGRYLVRQGMGCMLTYEGLFDASESSDLRFVPFAPRFEAHQGLVGGPPCPTSRRGPSSTPWNAYARGMRKTTQASRRPYATVSAFPAFFAPTPSSRRHETSI